MRFKELKLVASGRPIHEANQDSAAARRVRIGPSRSESIGFYPDFTDTSKKPDNGQKECSCRREEGTSEEFKRGAVEQVRQPGVSYAQVARELGIGANLLSRWAREFKAKGGQAFGGTGSPRDEEVARLKRELTRVKKERDFLREAATFFARESS
jgi:transposase